MIRPNPYLYFWKANYPKESGAEERGTPSRTVETLKYWLQAQVLGESMQVRDEDHHGYVCSIEVISSHKWMPRQFAHWWQPPGLTDTGRSFGDMWALSWYRLCKLEFA